MDGNLNQEKLRQFYDHFGAKQDAQGFYEDAALDALVQLGGFEGAQSVFEIGCGTGKFADRLLTRYLPPTAKYVGIDLSATMVQLARTRLARWELRAEVKQSDGGFDFSSLGGPFDRIVCTYVFDLMSPAQIEAALAGAHSVTRTGGLLCSAGLTRGIGPFSRTTSRLWTFVHRLNPYLVGGCRPLELADFLSERDWRLTRREVVVAATVPSEVITAEPL